MADLATNFQRIGSISNAHVGADFEALVQAHWLKQGTELTRNFVLPYWANWKNAEKQKF